MNIYIPTLCDEQENPYTKRLILIPNYPDQRTLLPIPINRNTDDSSKLAVEGSNAPVNKLFVQPPT